MSRQRDEQLQLRRLDLVALTEHPEARLLARDPAGLNEAEQVAATVLRLLGLLDAPHYDDQQEQLLLLLASTEPRDCAGYAAALQALGARQFLVLLRRAYVVLGFEPDTPLAQRAARIDHLFDRHRRVLGHIAWRLYALDLTDLLWHWLERHRPAIRGWRPRLAPDRGGRPPPAPPAAEQSRSAREPAAWREQHRRVQAGDGRLALFLLLPPQRQIWWQGYADLLSAWCRGEGEAELVQGRRHARIGTEPRDWDRLVARGALFCARGPDPLPERDRRQAFRTWLAALAAARRWVLLPWPNTLQELPLALLTTDPAVAARFEQVLQQSQHAGLRLCSYLDCADPEAHAGGILFDQNIDHGASAWQAGLAEGVAPWLVLQFHGYREQGDWWRPHSAILPCAGWRQSAYASGQPLVRTIHRAADRAAFAALWSQLSRDCNAALACASGQAQPQAVLDALDAIDGHAGLRQAMLLSQRCGWGYMHVWGGGCDEHQALFHARDPVLAARVCEVMGTHVAGRW